MCMREAMIGPNIKHLHHTLHLPGASLHTCSPVCSSVPVTRSSRLVKGTCSGKQQAESLGDTQSVRRDKAHQQHHCIGIIRGIKMQRTFTLEPWQSNHTRCELLEVQRKNHLPKSADNGQNFSTPTWRIWPLRWWRTGEVAGYISLHLPVLMDGLMVKGVPVARGNRLDRHLVDLYLFASNPEAHSATAACAEQHWLQPGLCLGASGSSSGSGSSSSSGSSSGSCSGGPVVFGGELRPPSASSIGPGAGTCTRCSAQGPVVAAQSTECGGSSVDWGVALRTHGAAGFLVQADHRRAGPDSQLTGPGERPSQQGLNPPPHAWQLRGKQQGAGVLQGSGTLQGAAQQARQQGRQQQEPCRIQHAQGQQAQGQHAQGQQIQGQQIHGQQIQGQQTQVPHKPLLLDVSSGVHQQDAAACSNVQRQDAAARRGSMQQHQQQQQQQQQDAAACSSKTLAQAAGGLEACEVDSWVLQESQATATYAANYTSHPDLSGWARLPLPQECTYGIEIEMLVWKEISQRDLQELLENQADVQSWRVVRDGSINAPSRGCTGVEVVSPILSGMQGLAQIHRVTSVLASLPASANPSCAVHVHVGVHGGWQLGHLKSLLQLFAIHEPTLDLLVPAHRRGNNNRHCISVATPPSGGGGLSQGVRSAVDVDSLVAAANPYGRCYKLNLRALSEHGTVEFRHPGSSRSPHTLCGFVVLYLALVQQAARTSRDPALASAVSTAAAAAGSTAATTAADLAVYTTAAMYASAAAAGKPVSGQPAASGSSSSSSSSGGQGNQAGGIHGHARANGTQEGDWLCGSSNGFEANAGMHGSSNETICGVHGRQAWGQGGDEGVGAGGQLNSANALGALAEVLGPLELLEWMQWQKLQV